MKSVLISLAGILFSSWVSAQLPALRTTEKLPETSDPQAVLPSRSKLSLKSGLEGESRANSYEQFQNLTFSLNPLFSYQLTDWARLKSELSASFTKGYSYTQGSPAQDQGKIDLREVVFEVQPFQTFRFQAGAISQSRTNLPQLVSGTLAFPGFAQEWMPLSGTFEFSLRAQQALLTGSQNSLYGSESQKLPVLLIEEVFSKFKVSRSLQIAFRGGHFRFQELTSGFAEAGLKTGNTILEIGPGNNRFRFDFDGLYGVFESDLRITRRWETGAFWSLIQNQQADPSYGQAQRLGASLSYRVRPFWNLKASGEKFFAESDVAPGPLVASSFGLNNREGWMAELRSEHKGFQMSVRYIHSDIIQQSSVQYDERTVLANFALTTELL